MNKLTTMLAMAFFALLTLNVDAKIENKQFHAVVTFFWTGEDGSRFDCDGDRLHQGIAAVDFNVIPKGSVLNINNTFVVVAKDQGGSAVISRKAAHERGCNCVIIDIWEPSKAKAMSDEAKLPKVVLVSIVNDSRPSKKSSRPQITQIHPFLNHQHLFCAYSSKVDPSIRHYARIEDLVCVD
jgi:3D (Asp-Asp-Asp) domain-containing protein